jgi:hypothetical protein
LLSLRSNFNVIPLSGIKKLIVHTVTLEINAKQQSYDKLSDSGHSTCQFVSDDLTDYETIYIDIIYLVRDEPHVLRTANGEK